jgi:hypothetical protein
MLWFMVDFCEHSNEFSGFINDGELLGRLSDDHLVGNGSPPPRLVIRSFCKTAYSETRVKYCYVFYSVCTHLAIWLADAQSGAMAPARLRTHQAGTESFESRRQQTLFCDEASSVLQLRPHQTLENIQEIWLFFITMVGFCCKYSLWWWRRYLSNGHGLAH